MPSLWIYIISLVILGVVTGYLAGLIGIGGGILLVPVFVTFFREFGVAPTLVMHMAIATALALAAPASWIGSWKQHRQGMLDWRYFGTWAAALAIGSVVALVIHNFVSSFVLKIIFMVVVLLFSLYVAFGGHKLVLMQARPTGWIKAVLAGGIGLVSVLIGASGGAFTTPAMLACSDDLRRAMALALASAAVVSTVGAVGDIIIGLGVPGRPHFALGYVDILVWAVMLIPMMVMAPLGARSCARWPRAVIRWIDAGFLFAMAVYMFFETVR